MALKSKSILFQNFLSLAPKSGAFSLVELLLVLGIITIFSAIALPRYGAASSRYRADLAARRIAADLELAQTIARAKGASQRVRIRQGVEKLIIFATDALDPHQSRYKTDFSMSPYNADIVSSVFNGDNYIIFNGWGIPDSGGTVVIRVGNETRTIAVDAQTGKAVIQ